MEERLEILIFGLEILAKLIVVLRTLLFSPQIVEGSSEHQQKPHPRSASTVIHTYLTFPFPLVPRLHVFFSSCRYGLYLDNFVPSMMTRYSLVGTECHQNQHPQRKCPLDISPKTSGHANSTSDIKGSSRSACQEKQIIPYQTDADNHVIPAKRSDTYADDLCDTVVSFGDHQAFPFRKRDGCRCACLFFWLRTSSTNAYC